MWSKSTVTTVGNIVLLKHTPLVTVMVSGLVNGRTVCVHYQLHKMSVTRTSFPLCKLTTSACFTHYSFPLVHLWKGGQIFNKLSFLVCWWWQWWPTSSDTGSMDSNHNRLWTLCGGQRVNKKKIQTLWSLSIKWLIHCLHNNMALKKCACAELQVWPAQ